MTDIIIVDDEKDIRTSVKQILEKEGYRIIEAVNGEDLFEKLKETKPDLILLDIMMPGMTTREIFKKLNENKDTKNIKIIFLTVVQISEMERTRILKSKKVVDYIQKPFDVDVLKKRVKKALKQKI